MTQLDSVYALMLHLAASRPIALTLSKIAYRDLDCGFRDGVSLTPPDSSECVPTPHARSAHTPKLAVGLRLDCRRHQRVPTLMEHRQTPCTGFQ